MRRRDERPFRQPRLQHPEQLHQDKRQAYYDALLAHEPFFCALQELLASIPPSERDPDATYPTVKLLEQKLMPFAGRWHLPGEIASTVERPSMGLDPISDLLPDGIYDLWHTLRDGAHLAGLPTWRPMKAFLRVERMAALPAEIPPPALHPVPYVLLGTDFILPRPAVEQSIDAALARAKRAWMAAADACDAQAKASGWRDAAPLHLKPGERGRSAYWLFLRVHEHRTWASIASLVGEPDPEETGKRRIEYAVKALGRDVGIATALPPGRPRKTP